MIRWKNWCLLPCIVLVLATHGLAEERERPLVFGVNRVGDAALLHNPPDYSEHMYQRIREAGGTCVRIVAAPRDIEPIRGLRNWDEFDRDLDLAIKYEQEPMVCIVNIPAWASPTGEATHAYPYKTDMLPDFADFCTELARRTRGKVRMFQLWNEQNGCGWHCQDGFNFADEYFPMLTTCYEALKKGNPDCVLSLGSLDDAEGHAPIFLRKTYEEMQKNNVPGPVFDAVSDHPYSENSEIMRGKLDALREILTSRGAEGTPFWITEYGWHTGNTSLDTQAAKMAEVLEAFTQPAWKDLEASVYLCIADFEQTNEGFGLTDANLRPRPAFYAFQAASRFGAYPPYRIEHTFLAADRVAISWKTLKPTTGKVTMTLKEDKSKTMTAETRLGTEHKVEFGSLTPDTVYRFVIETVAEKDKKNIRSAPYEIRSPGQQVFNGDFEQGFFAGIAHGWRIEGKGHCTDAALVPRTMGVQDKHAQFVFAFGDQPLDSTLSAVVAAEPGEPIRITFSWAGKRGVESGIVSARAGIGPAGTGDDPSAVKWTEWQEMKLFGEKADVSAKAANSVVRFLVQCRSENPAGRGRATFVLDNVRVEQP